MADIKQKSSRLWRIAASFILIALLIAWVGPDNMIETIGGFQWPYFMIALGLLLAHLMAQSLTLKILLAGQQLQASAFHIFRITMIANFFGVFLPGAIGPDMILCYNMAKSTDRKEVALSSIIFIRIAVLLIMALMGFAGAFNPLVARPEIFLLTSSALVGFAFYFFLMSNQRMLAFAEKLIGQWTRHRLIALLSKTYFALAQTATNRSVLKQVLPLLITSALIKIVADYFIARALGIDIPLLYFFVFIPLITIISAIPLTFAGLGVREGSYAGLFALVGVPAEQSILVSLASFTLVIMVAIIGAVVYMLNGKSVKLHDDRSSK
jgi:uncharacterized protein (TIRG00374 family)